MPADAELSPILERARESDGGIVVLTGAGISAESGIPTFRGPDGYWTVGSVHYRAEELATFRAFREMPEEVWSWYLYRRGVCRAAAPNAAHAALVDLEHEIRARFCLITQNVDGLHLRAGNTAERTLQIHGNLDYVRCAGACGSNTRPFPDGFTSWPAGRTLAPEEAARLHCPKCGDWLRPHVLWFDECYDEATYRYESSLRAAQRAQILLVIGTSGATTLPILVCETVHRRGAPMIVVNPDPSPFTEMAERNPLGHHLADTACSAVPDLVATLCGTNR